MGPTALHCPLSEYRPGAGLAITTAALAGDGLPPPPKPTPWKENLSVIHFETLLWKKSSFIFIDCEQTLCAFSNVLPDGRTVYRDISLAHELS